MKVCYKTELLITESNYDFSKFRSKNEADAAKNFDSQICGTAIKEDVGIISLGAAPSKLARGRITKKRGKR